MLKFTKSFKKAISSVVALGMVTSMAADVNAASLRSSKAQIIVDYNTNIGTGNKYIFGGAGIPSTDEAIAWSSLNSEMGVKLVKIPVDLSRLYPNSNGEVDTDVKEEYLHVASGQFTRARGAGMDIMLEFVNLPSWLDADNNKKYDDEDKYVSMIKGFLTESVEYKDIVKFIEVTPDNSLSSDDFVDVYYTTAKAIRSLGPDYIIGGPGYTLSQVNDNKLGKIEQLLTRYKEESDKTLLQYVSLKAYSVDATHYANDYFGEFKEGRKKIRQWSDNADIPVFLTGWSTVGKNATSPDNNVTGANGIKQQANALFKSMRDGWDLVLFDSTTSSKNSPESYSYTVDNSGNIVMNPFTKAWNLLSNKLKLGNSDFKVVSTDMGSNWVVDDSIAMLNSSNEAVVLATNFSNEKTGVTLELKNVPYEDGDVQLECYVAKEGANVNTAYATVSAKVVNGIINATIPSIPSNGAVGIVVKGGTEKNMPAQSMYEFESQDNHFGGNTEITWQSGASFNRVVKNFGGNSNFVTLKKVAADGTGTYTAKLYTNSGNSNIKVSINDASPITVKGSSASLTKPVEFDIELEAGNSNTIKVWTESGELRADRLVLVAKNIQLSIGFQNLNSLASEGEGTNKKYVLPLARKDFKVDGRIFPENAAGSQTIQYTSSNTEVVNVNNEGLLTPVAVGEAEITATIEGKTEIKNTFKLVVKNAVSGITVSPKTLSLKPNQTSTITAQINPADAENKNIVWTSSNPSVIEIVSSDNNNAQIKVVADSGNSIITAKTVEGGYEATSSVSVNKPELAGAINIDYGNTISNGSSGIFGVTHYPSINKTDSDVGDHSVVWEMLRDDMGVKFMRADARLQEILPIWVKTPDTNWAANSNVEPGQPSYVEADYYYVTGPDGVDRQFTVEGYREDMEHVKSTGEYLNGMSNPENWNTDRLMSWIQKADEMGFEVMVMTFQIPEWLASGYPLPGAPHTEKACNSAPKDWEIFRDIIQKVYTMVKPYTDYYEFLNEPHWYVPKGGDQRRPDGTAYPDSNKVNLIASDTMYQAIDAIYELEGGNLTMKLGGGADDSWGGDYGVLGTIFSEEYPQEWQDRVEFVSIHKYGERPANQDNSNDGANSRNLKYWLRQRTNRDISIFLNEYNASTGQPHDYHTGAKSMSYHGRIMIDMMVDGYEGGGYYTCYPSDVPMDDYEASAGWVERGKGVYAWNNGNPTLATFTKTWNLLSKKLGLGDGDFKVKSTDVSNSKISDGIGAINANGTPVAFLTNCSATEYGDVVIKMNNIPYEVGNDVTVKVYSMTTSSEITMEPVVTTETVAEDGSIIVNIDEVGSNGVVGVIVEGNTTAIKDTTVEFESYVNTLIGKAKIDREDSASNKRWVKGIANGEATAVDVTINGSIDGDYKLNISYNSPQEVTLSYVVNGGNVDNITLPATTEIGVVEIEVVLASGENTIKFFNDGGAAIALDKIEVNHPEITPVVVDKTALGTLIEEMNKQLEESKPEEYFEETWTSFVAELEKAKAVYANESATQKEVDKAYADAKNAYDGLVLKPSKEKLEELINKAKGLDETKYTAETWKVLQEELTVSKSVLENDNATEEEIEKAVNKINLAIESLVLVDSDEGEDNENGGDDGNNGGTEEPGDGNGDNSNDGGTEKPGDDNGGTTGDNKPENDDNVEVKPQTKPDSSLPQTGQESNKILYAVIMLALGGALIYKRKVKES